MGEWDGIDPDRAARAAALSVRVDDTFDWTGAEVGAITLGPPPAAGPIVLSVSWLAQGLTKVSLTFDN